MKTTRLAGVLLPLLAARGWLPWLLEPQHLEEPLASAQPLSAASSNASSCGHGQRCRFDELL